MSLKNLNAIERHLQKMGTLGKPDKHQKQLTFMDPDDFCAEKTEDHLEPVSKKSSKIRPPAADLPMPKPYRPKDERGREEDGFRNRYGSDPPPWCSECKYFAGLHPYVECLCPRCGAWRRAMIIAHTNQVNRDGRDSVEGGLTGVTKYMKDLETRNGLAAVEAPGAGGGVPVWEPDPGPPGEDVAGEGGGEPGEEIPELPWVPGGPGGDDLGTAGGVPVLPDERSVPRVRSPGPAEGVGGPRHSGDELELPGF